MPCLFLVIAPRPDLRAHSLAALVPDLANMPWRRRASRRRRSAGCRSSRSSATCISASSGSNPCSGRLGHSHRVRCDHRVPMDNYGCSACQAGSHVLGGKSYVIHRPLSTRLCQTIQPRGVVSHARRQRYAASDTSVIWGGWGIGRVVEHVLAKGALLPGSNSLATAQHQSNHIATMTVATLRLGDTPVLHSIRRAQAAVHLRNRISKFFAPLRQRVGGADLARVPARPGAVAGRPAAAHVRRSGGGALRAGLRQAAEDRGVHRRPRSAVLHKRAAPHVAQGGSASLRSSLQCRRRLLSGSGLAECHAAPAEHKLAAQSRQQDVDLMTGRISIIWSWYAFSVTTSLPQVTHPTPR